jgi:mRNA interferase MazF
VIEKGQIYWLLSPVKYENDSSVSHPHVVIQETAINLSRIETIAACAISTNMARAYDAGNVLLDDGEGGLDRRSFIAVGQVSAVHRSNFGKLIGKLSDKRIQDIYDGLIMRSNFEDIVENEI